MNKLYISIIFFLTITSCVAPLDKTIQLTTIPEPQITAPEFTIQPSITIGFFKDLRAGSYIVKNYDNYAQPANSVSEEVEDVLRRTFTNAGFNVNNSAPVILKGEIRTWNVDVKNTLPVVLESKAEIWIEVIGPDDKRIFSGRYSGKGRFEQPTAEVKDIQRALNTSMTATISGIFKERKLMELLSSF